MKFEYATVKFETSGIRGGDLETDEFSEMLNIWGQQGWELVNALDTNFANGASRYIVAIFKRQI